MSKESQPKVETKNWNDMTTTERTVSVVVGAVIFFIVIAVMVWLTSASNQMTDTSQANDTEQSVDQQPDDTIANIEREAKDGLCTYQTKGTPLFTVEGFYGQMMGSFATIGKKLFAGDVCENFIFQAKTDTDDGRGNTSENIVLSMSASKEQFSQYNWDNLSGRTVYDQLSNDGIIIFMNTVDVDTDKIRLGTVE